MKRFSKKKNVLFLLVLIGIFGIGFSVFALELDWPDSMNIHLDDDSALTELIAYIYEWAIAIGGIATFIALVSAGFQYLTSAGDVGKTSDAKKQITSAIVGLTLLLSSVLILDAINPELTTLEIAEIDLTGRTFDPVEVESFDLTGECVEARVNTLPNFGGSTGGVTTTIAVNGSEDVTISSNGSIRVLGNCSVGFYFSEGCSDSNPVVNVFSTNPRIGGLLGNNVVNCIKVEQL